MVTLTRAARKGPDFPLFASLSRHQPFMGITVVWNGEVRHEELGGWAWPVENPRDAAHTGLGGSHLALFFTDPVPETRLPASSPPLFVCGQSHLLPSLVPQRQNRI